MRYLKHCLFPTFWDTFFLSFGGRRASSSTLLCKMLKVAERDGIYG